MKKLAKSNGNSGLIHNIEINKAVVEEIFHKKIEIPIYKNGLAFDAFPHEIIPASKQYCSKLAVKIYDLARKKEYLGLIQGLNPADLKEDSLSKKYKLLTRGIGPKIRNETILNIEERVEVSDMIHLQFFEPVRGEKERIFGRFLEWENGRFSYNAYCPRVFSKNGERLIINEGDYVFGKVVKLWGRTSLDVEPISIVKKERALKNKNRIYHENN